MLIRIFFEFDYGQFKGNHAHRNNYMADLNVVRKRPILSIVHFDLHLLDLEEDSAYTPHAVHTPITPRSISTSGPEFHSKPEKGFDPALNNMLHSLHDFQSIHEALQSENQRYQSLLQSKDNQIHSLQEDVSRERMQFNGIIDGISKLRTRLESVQTYSEQLDRFRTACEVKIGEISAVKSEITEWRISHESQSANNIQRTQLHFYYHIHI